MKNEMLFDLVVCVRDALNTFIARNEGKICREEAPIVDDEPEEDEGLDVDSFISDDTLSDGVTLSHRARKAKMDIIKVKAPAIADGAFPTLNAYPVHLLRKFYSYR